MEPRRSLVILRDMMFGNRRYFRELLHNSVEGIASNILANRLQRLVDNGLISRAKDPSHKQKIRYSLSEPAIQLVWIMAHLGAWGRRHLPVTASSPSARNSSRRARVVGAVHGRAARAAPGHRATAATELVLAQLQAAYEAELVAR